MSVLFARNPEVAKEILKDQFGKLRAAGWGAEDPEDKRAEIDEARADEHAKRLQTIVLVCLVVSVGVFAGGLAMATGFVNVRVPNAFVDVNP